METALIIGATKGLGQEIATLCQEKDWKTIEVGSSVKDTASLRKITKYCDLTSEHSVRELMAWLGKQQIDHFFYVAGKIIKGDFAEQSHEDISSTVDVNLRSALLISNAAWRRMHHTKTRATFTVIASSSGIKARADEAVYAATKHGLVGFTRSLGLANNNKNISVYLFMPGGMQTPFWDKIGRAKDFDTYLDPKKVAAKIMETQERKEPFVEVEIPRGSL